MDSIPYLIFRRMRAPLLVLILTYALAMLGLVLIPGQDGSGEPTRMSFFHAFYFVSFMSTTIGFGEVPHDFTDGQRLWVTLCIYSTVIAWLYSAGTLIALIRDKTFQRVFSERRFAKRVRSIGEPFFLVCGFGQTGSGLVRALTDRGQRAVVMDASEDRINLLKLENLREYVPALAADARRPEVLRMGGLYEDNCAGVLALTAKDSTNLKIAIASKLLHPDATVICRAESKDFAANMESFGTDYIFDPFETFAVYLATALQAPCLTLLYDWLAELGQESPISDPIYPPAKGLWILCGYGRFGKAIYEHLSGQEGLELIVVEQRPDLTGSPDSALVRGRGTEADTLEEAQIERAVGLVAGTNNDANNLSIAMTARALKPDLFVVARENHLENEPLFDAVGAQIIMHPSSIVANRIRMLLGTPLLSVFVGMARFQGDRWACELVSRIAAIVDEELPDVWEVALDAEHALAVCDSGSSGHFPMLGTLLLDPRERDRTLPAIVLMRRHGSDSELLPPPERRLQRGDRLLFCGRRSARNKMQWTLQNRHALQYVETGASYPEGAIWRWLLAFQRRFQRDTPD